MADARLAQSNLPAATYLVLTFSVLSTALFLREPGLLERWAFIPGVPFRHLIVSLFVHANWSHLFSNGVLFFLVGEELEAEIGPAKFLGGFFLSGIGGNLLYARMHGVQASIGMSGALMGLLVFYALSFPSRNIVFSRLLASFRKGFTVFKLRVPVPVVALFYIGMDSVALYNQSGGQVNHFAHIGGALTGLFCFSWRR